MRTVNLYDIEYVLDGQNEQETGLTEDEMERRTMIDLPQDGATDIRVIAREEVEHAS